MSRIQDPSVSIHPGPPRLRPIQAPALAALEDALNERRRAHVEHALAVGAEFATSARARALVKDPNASVSRMLSLSKTLRAARWSSLGAEVDRSKAQEGAEHAAAAAVSSMLGNPGFRVSTTAFDYYFQKRHLDPWFDENLVDHVTAYRLRGRRGQATWRDTALVLQPYAADETVASALARVNSLPNCPVYADVIPPSWAWWAPENPMSKMILVYGRAFARRVP